MDNIEFQKHISSVYKFNKTGNKDLALKMLGILCQAYPEENDTITMVKAEIVLDDIEISKLKKTYCENKSALEKYKFFFGKLPSLPQWYVIECTDKKIVAFNIYSKEVKQYEHKNVAINTDELQNKSVYVEGAVFNADILQVKPCEGLNGLKIPVYLSYQSQEAEIILQVISIKETIISNSFIFMVGEQGIEECFNDSYMLFPNLIFSYESNEIIHEKVLQDIVDKKGAQTESGLKELNEYYNSKDNGLEHRVQIGKPRILFWTSRFTTTIQYHTRDVMDSAIKLGCECLYLIEPDPLQRITKEKQIEIFKTFRPDVVFCIDHFRFENDFLIPKQIIYVTWIQDPLKEIIDPKSAQRLTERDCLLNHLVNDKEVKKIYGNMLIDAPIPASSAIYKPYHLTEEEKRNYSADICFVCHASDAEAYIEKTIMTYEMIAEDKRIIDVIRDILYDYKEKAYLGEFFYSRDEFVDYIVDKFMIKGYELKKENATPLADELEKWYNQRLFRQVLVDWILDAGFTNIKLWGNGWMANPKYQKYAMGPAENGEVLSKIYQASKIVVGNNIRTTGAARAWESMLSGAFYLSNYIPPENDICDIRKIIPEGSFEIFRNRDELIDKLKMYLQDDALRKNMAKKGRLAVLDKMTFDKLADKLLKILPSYL